MQCQPLFQALRFRRCTHHMKLYVWEQEAAMNLARLTSESSITSGNGLNLNVDGIYWPATVGWNTKSQSQNRGGGLLFFPDIPIYFSNSQRRGGFCNAEGAALINWPMHASFHLTKMIGKLLWCSKKQTNQFQAVLSPLPPRPYPPIGRKHKQDPKMTDLRISHIFLMKPFVTPAFTVTLKRNSTCFSETIIFLQIMGPPKTGLEKCIPGLEFSGTTLAFKQKSFISLLAGNVLGAHGQEDSVSTRVPQEWNQVGEGPLKEALVKQIRQRITSSQGRRSNSGPLKQPRTSLVEGTPPYWDWWSIAAVLTC